MLQKRLLYDQNMGNMEKLLFQILKGTSDANLRFGDLCNLLVRLGFEMRPGEVIIFLG